jgi:hypothetical protein
MHVRPVARDERSRCVDVRDALVGGRDDVANERGRSATERPRDLGQSSSREPAGQHAIERLDSRWQCVDLGRGRGSDRGDTLSEGEQCGGRHVVMTPRSDELELLERCRLFAGTRPRPLAGISNAMRSAQPREHAPHPGAIVITHVVPSGVRRSIPGPKVWEFRFDEREIPPAGIRPEPERIGKDVLYSGVRDSREQRVERGRIIGDPREHGGDVDPDIESRRRQFFGGPEPRVRGRGARLDAPRERAVDGDQRDVYGDARCASTGRCRGRPADPL